MSSENKIMDNEENPNTEVKKEKLADLREQKFNLSRMVEKFVLAQVVHEMLRAKQAPDAGYYLGIAQGYVDFFMELALPDSVIQAIVKTLDIKIIEEKAKEIVAGANSKIIVAGAHSQLDMRMISMLKQSFDSKITGK